MVLRRMRMSQQYYIERRFMAIGAQKLIEYGMAVHLNHYFHLHVCPSFCLSVCTSVTLQRFIPLIAPDASTH